MNKRIVIQILFVVLGLWYLTLPIDLLPANPIDDIISFMCAAISGGTLIRGTIHKNK